MSKVIAFIPVRGGSKSIPLKNIKPLAGKPLLYWASKAAIGCQLIDEVYLSTDADEIKKVINQEDLDCKIHDRLADNAMDHSSSESVLLEFIEDLGLENEDIVIMLQVTSPFTTSDHLSQALKQYDESFIDSLLSVTESKRFFWNSDGSAMNYDPMERPRRQDFQGQLQENGAFYISSAGQILRSKNRLSGKIGLYTMPEHTALELDEPHDWLIAEQLMKAYLT